LRSLDDCHMVRRLLPMVLLVLLGACSCSRGPEISSARPEDRLALAEELQTRGKCGKAVLEYEALLSEFPTQQVAERARFNLAKCRMEIGEYDLARSDLEDFIDSYPKSGMVDNAMYLIAVTYLREAPRAERDQTRTVKALNELYLLLREYPDSDVRGEVEKSIARCRSKLAEKDYLSGQLYLKLRSYRSAHIYFDSVISEYGDTPWLGRALLGKGAAYAGQREYAEARAVYERVLGEFPVGAISDEAARRLKELEFAVDTESQASSED
jgi:outer membrane protein assembly factor BamD